MWPKSPKGWPLLPIPLLYIGRIWYQEVLLGLPFFGLPCDRNRDSSVKPLKVRGMTGITLLTTGIGTLAGECYTAVEVGRKNPLALSLSTNVRSCIRISTSNAIALSQLAFH